MTLSPVALPLLARVAGRSTLLLLGVCGSYPLFRSLPSSWPRLDYHGRTYKTCVSLSAGLSISTSTTSSSHAHLFKKRRELLDSDLASVGPRRASRDRLYIARHYPDIFRSCGSLGKSDEYRQRKTLSHLKIQSPPP
jgi:hypothetical protein